MICLYVDQHLRSVASVNDPQLESFTERHYLRLSPAVAEPTDDIAGRIASSPARGVIFGISMGLPSYRMLSLMRGALARDRAVFLYWPSENAIEAVDRERQWDLLRHKLLLSLVLQYLRFRPLGERIRGVAARARRAVATRAAVKATKVILDDYSRSTKQFQALVAPVPFKGISTAPSENNKIRGTGVYVRTDYWAHLISGGSYGHTCYVAQELSKITENFVCLLGSRFALLDDLGVSQEIVSPRYSTTSEIDHLRASAFYYGALRERLQRIKPAYIFERLVLGNFAVARLSRELGIPYIVEYNGSEISMKRSFGGGALTYEEQLLEAERLAFRQASIITTISEQVYNDVIRRGIAPEKVLINPNGVNCSEYARATDAERHEIRGALGFAPTDRVVGFIGTFGGWHGIDVLAQAIPEICRADPSVRFLLIGDGSLKHLVDNAVTKHRLQKQVVAVGRTDQRLGARYLKSADVYVSPHSSHMTDSKFFGSPTKLFEYMALGGGIVASDLEQIGATLTPALRSDQFQNGPPAVGPERAVLCKPGDVADFVAGVLGLVRYPAVAEALGRNARAAAEQHFSWESHVARIWEHALEQTSGSAKARIG